MFCTQSRNEISIGTTRHCKRKITVEEGHFLAHKLQDKIQNELPEIAHITIHIEPD